MIRKALLVTAIMFPPYSVAENESGGINSWNLGFGLGVEQYREDYIDTASIRGDQKIVTTEKRFETRPSAWMTMNWNIWGVGDKLAFNGTNDVNGTKFGFFAGVKLLDSTSDSFGAFALGPQISFLTKSNVISIGAGWVTHKTRKYAKGISAGEPLPAQYDDVVFEEGTENSYMVMMSVALW